VRVVAPHGLRLSALAEREGLDERSAARRLDQLDADREDFVRRHFHRDLSDPRNYDLVINVGGLGNERALDLLCHALRLRGLTD